ncbi:MAG: potassium channel family protein, partial [Spirochaetota bacterium]
AKQLNPNLRIIAQVEEEGAVQKLRKAGADRVISPKRIAGQRMASIILRPSVVNFLDVVVDRGDLSMRIEEVRVNASSPLIGKNLKEAGIGQHTGAIVVGINDPQGNTRINPSGTATISTIPIKEGDVLIAMGNEDQINKIKSFVQRGK